jgi:hypothetical protein
VEVFDEKPLLDVHRLAVGKRAASESGSAELGEWTAEGAKQQQKEYFSG